MKRLWLALWVGLVVVMSACSLLPTAAPDPAATEAAIERAVLATVTAVAALVPATPVPATPTSAPASPTAVAATFTPAASGARTGLATGTAGPAGTLTPATSQPAGTRTVIPLTGEEATYLRNLSVVIREYNQSFDRFRELFRDPEPEDASWRLRLGAELQLWADRAEPARLVVPPSTLASVHRRIVVGVGLYQQAAQAIPEAFRATDQAGLLKALEGVIQARTAFDEAEREMARLAQERGL